MGMEGCQMSKDEIQKVTLGTNEALRVTADGEFIWHPEADAMIENGDFTSSPAMRHILRALRKALAAPVQEPVATLWQHGETGRTRITMPGDITDCDARWFKASDLYTTPPAAPDLQAELDATNRQVEILSDALAESRRERQWVGLTDEEIEKACVPLGAAMLSFTEVAQAIEAKLKEKNNG
jgi:hypothetical protein